ncbi:MAG: hypothetical protein JNJ49_09855, partial [Bdellovibrionaceae bacterium]|nr:hypothetical protein [Pseudobdellovibrionaceae bacterium]
MKMESRLKSRFNFFSTSSGRLLRFVLLFVFVLSNSNCKQAEEWIGSGRKTKAFPGLPDISPSNVKAELVNVPSDGAADGSLSVLVGGDGVVGYSYKLGAAASLDCSDPSGYSLARVSAQVINDSIDSMVGSMGICVLGFDSEGRRQSIDDPTRYVWNRSWYPEVMIEAPGRQVVSDANVTLRLHAPASYTEV